MNQVARVGTVWCLPTTSRTQSVGWIVSITLPAKTVSRPMGGNAFGTSAAVEIGATRGRICVDWQHQSKYHYTVLTITYLFLKIISRFYSVSVTYTGAPPNCHILTCHSSDLLPQNKIATLSATCLTPWSRSSRRILLCRNST